MGRYPFFIGGRLNGKRVPGWVGDDAEPCIRMPIATEFAGFQHMYEPTRPLSDVCEEYRREIAFWNEGEGLERYSAWVHGRASFNKANDVELCFRCLHPLSKCGNYVYTRSMRCFLMKLSMYIAGR